MPLAMTQVGAGGCWAAGPVGLWAAPGCTGPLAAGSPQCGQLPCCTGDFASWVTLPLS